MYMQVKLVPYNPEYLDESVLWTESHDVGKGFRCIRMVNNIYLNFDAFHGDKDHGGVHDGTTVVLWEWAKGDNQRWKILPWCKCSNNTSCLPVHSMHALLYIILGGFIIIFSIISSAYTTAHPSSDAPICILTSFVLFMYCRDEAIQARR